MSFSVIACDGSKLVIVCRHIPPGKGVASDVFVEPLFGSSYLTKKSIPQARFTAENQYAAVDSCTRGLDGTVPKDSQERRESRVPGIGQRPIQRVFTDLPQCSVVGSEVRSPNMPLTQALTLTP